MIKSNSLPHKSKKRVKGLQRPSNSSFLRCPKCNGHNICDCKGGTCLKLDLNIKFICQDCLWEW
jgi:cytochrome c-type biogenesis protein CcmH/NrfF